jgi:lipid II:glycine glycyltransferase (peptidoglycan interpeptide bridge formation enzyme)
MLSWSCADDLADWDAMMVGLPACNLYQSQAWSRYRTAMGWRVVRAIGRDASHKIVAMVQMLVRRRLGLHVVWIPGGPIGDCRLWPASMIEFLNKRFGPLTYCRLNALSECQPQADEALPRGQWRRPATRLATGLSLKLDLRLTDEERLNAASANWRHNLRRSARYDLTVERWNKPDAAQMAAVYRDMEEYKGLNQQHSEAELRAMIDGLGENLLVLRCLDRDGNLLAFRAGGIFRDQAWDLLAAATRAARKVYASHATLWALLKECEQQGALSYDLGGVDPIRNKGVFDFKRGTGARMVEYLGEWEWANAPLITAAVGLLIRYRDWTA